MSKMYYSSSEVSTMLELEPSVLRFWEDQFGQLRIKRNRAGKRMYREKDIELIRTIKRLTRDEGYTIAGARKKLQESAANRGAEKSADGPVKAAPGAEQADPGTVLASRGERADPGAALVTPGDQSDPGTEQADPDLKQSDPGERKDTLADSSSQSELMRWLRSRLIEIRDSMD